MTAITFPLTYEEQRKGLLSGRLKLFRVFISTSIEDGGRLIWMDDVFFDTTIGGFSLKEVFDDDALRDIEESLEHDNPGIDKETFWASWNLALLNPDECVRFSYIPTEYLLERPKPPGADLMEELYGQ